MVEAESRVEASRRRTDDCVTFENTARIKAMMQVVGEQKSSLQIVSVEASDAQNSNIEVNMEHVALTLRCHYVQANRVRFPAVSLPDSRMWESCWTMQLLVGFSRGSPVSPDPSFRRCSISRFTLIGSQELDVKSHLNRFSSLANIPNMSIIPILPQEKGSDEERKTENANLHNSAALCADSTLKKLSAAAVVASQPTSRLNSALMRGLPRIYVPPALSIPLFNIVILRANEMRMEQRRNARTGETVDLREHPPISGIVQDDYQLAKIRSDRVGD
ncbi:hypothetical protein PR048_003398 [Dryococelus australis]|uniref:Uncharacterized protein n=1 Tax=Dryococelus australis TaxID=614101 RepID=A0ABQ9IMX0_9NEOP|nr:hypothetical protein PR048_003398 [Dryococelus australis]